MNYLSALSHNSYASQNRFLDARIQSKGAAKESFAADIIKRTGLQDAKVQGDKNQEISPEALLKQERLSSLESALSSTVNYMAKNYGDAAGTAMMGIVYKGIGNSTITEDNLGNAFLDVVRFVDKQFGTKEGDDLIRHLNGNLNKSMNELFDNGKNEVFYAVGSEGAELPERKKIHNLEFSGVDQKDTDFNIDIVKTMLEDLEKTDRDALLDENLSKELKAYLHKNEGLFEQGIIKDIQV